jgi:hypothetical protein
MELKTWPVPKNRQGLRKRQRALGVVNSELKLVLSCNRLRGSIPCACPQLLLVVGNLTPTAGLFGPASRSWPEGRCRSLPAPAASKLADSGSTRARHGPRRPYRWEAGVPAAITGRGSRAGKDKPAKDMAAYMSEGPVRAKSPRAPSRRPASHRRLPPGPRVASH